MAKEKEVVKVKPVTKVKDTKEVSRTKISHRFVTALSIVSILGFLGILSETIFSYDLSSYIESLLMLVVGIGLMIEVKIDKLKTLKEGITPANITHLTTVCVGAIAIIAGVFSFPGIRIETAAFHAIKGIMAIIAILVIIIQTWIID